MDEHQATTTTSNELINLLLQDGLGEGLPRIAELLMNAAMLIERATRVVGLFPNESSLLRLVTGIVIEISEEWETGKIYLQPESQKTTQPN